MVWLYKGEFFYQFRCRMKTSVKLFGRRFANPLFLPSGIVNDIPGHKIAVDAGAGAVVLKSVTMEKREGNPIPRVAKYAGGFINSVGLRNPGLKQAKKEVRDFLKTSDTPVIVSVFAARISDFRQLVEEMAPLKPAAIELNLSCPNVEGEFGSMMADNRQSSAEATRIAKKVAGKVPLICKLTPNTANIGEIAKACEAEGADAIAAINTVATGMIIDIHKRKPVLGAKKGGVSGPGIKPIAIARVYEIYEAVKIPVLGLGGITTWEDVIEMMMAGAALVGVGSAVYLHGYKIYGNLMNELKEFMKKEGVSDITSFTGAAHHS